MARLNTRIILKNDVIADWENADSLSLHQGEVALAKNENNTYELRVGQEGKQWKEALPLQLSASQIVGLETKLDDVTTSNYAGVTTVDPQKATPEQILAEANRISGKTADDYKKGDTLVLKELIAGEGDEAKYQHAAYVWNGEAWAAMDGTYNADSVYFNSEFTLAGTYTEIGNIKKSEGTYDATGKSLTDVMTKIFTKELSGEIASQPSASGATLKAKVNGAGSLVTAGKSYEYGTYLTDIEFSGATFTKGTYTYGPTSNQTPSSWATTATNSVSITTGAADVAGTLESIVLGDQGKDTDNETLSGYTTVSAVKITSTATYAADTAKANTNLNVANSTHTDDGGWKDVSIAAGTKGTTSGEFTGFRKAFWGAVAATATQLDTTALTSAQVRALGNSQATNPPTSFTAPAGTKQIIFAVPAGKKSSLTAKDGNALNAPVVFTKLAKGASVEGANGYTAIDYDVWYCILDAAAGAAKAMALALTWA